MSAKPSDLLLELVRRRNRDGDEEEDDPARCCISFEDGTNFGGEGGKYRPPGVDDRCFPDIWIDRPGPPQFGLEGARSSPDPLNELIWLAHELGHHDSWLAGFRVPLHDPNTAEVDERKGSPFDVFAEELRAWFFARKILEGIGFEDWNVFNSSRLSGLDSYRVGLKLAARDATRLENDAQRWFAETGRI